jgi:acetyl-CoA acyltransferase
LIMTRTEAYIVDAVRTPVGKYGGILRDIRPDDLGALAIRALIEKNRIDGSLVQDVLWGCANQAGEDNRNVGRMAALLAGLPNSVPATTINRLCGSSLDAINHGARAVWSGDLDLLIAGGVESMSRAPYSVPKNQSGSFGNVTAYDTALGWRYPNPALEKLFPLESMGETAENIAEAYTITREEQDVFALESHRRAVAAQDAGSFDSEIVTIPVPLPKSAPPEPGTGSGEEIREVNGRRYRLVRKDECPRRETSLQQLAGLQPVFRKGGSVTPGNSSSLNDGAAAVLMMSERSLKASGLEPMARIVSTVVAGVDPRMMGIGPVPASRRALEKAGLTIDQIDLVELNEAFAVQALAVIRDLRLDRAKLNVNGGAIAIGHPLGCSGARIMTTLLHEMRRRKARYGLATMCIGVGQGIATLVERI